MIGSLFSGIGGLELGLEWAGLGPVAWQVEIDPYCRAVLAKHWPGVTRFEDVREVGSHCLGPVDVICGGFPCQDVSSAGRGAGLSGERSGLWREYRRIVGELRPPWVIVENVASGKRRWLPHVRHDLRVLGYDSIAFQVSAFNVGAPHRRERVFVLASNSDRLQLWQQQGRGSREDWGDPAESASDGQERAAANSDDQGELQSEGGIQNQWRWTCYGHGWSIESPVCGVAYGVPSRLDRVKALGNAVVPQCAYSVGLAIKEMMQ